MLSPDFTSIVKDAWQAYDASREIDSITNISAMVSTNHVFKVTFTDHSWTVAKLSYFGTYEHFVEDHNVISVLGNNLPEPFENFLGKSLFKGTQVFTHFHEAAHFKAWVVFYNPVKIQERLPRKLVRTQIEKLGSEFAKLHLACKKVINTLPPVSKTLTTDLQHLLQIITTDFGKFEHRLHEEEIKRQCELFYENCDKLNYAAMTKLPVFVDWNIGNFSVEEDNTLFSRWDYDWFRVDVRMLDFYFFARVCSDVGDRTFFSYNIEPLMEDRFIWFLKQYHQHFPLDHDDILFMKETYRFFLLNYVVKDGRYFFHEIYASKLRKEAFDHHLPNLDKLFKPEKILKALSL